MSMSFNEVPFGGALRDVDAASAYLREKYGVRRTPRTLNRLRTIGGGPVFRRIGTRHVAYEEAALDAWARSLISAPLASTASLRSEA
jgi:hypothetical protein